MRVNRQQLLQRLELVQAGLATREAVEQSSCFVFKGGHIYTFNDETACRQDCEIGFEGALPAAPLVAILGKLNEEELEVNLLPSNEVEFKGKSRGMKLRHEANIILPLEQVEEPEVWQGLPEDFGDAIEIVQQCAGTDASAFVLTCIHLHPEHVEACDNFQLTRYPIQTGVEKATLVKREALRHVVGLGMSEISETKKWLHFRNPAGLVMSCRRYMEDYPNMEQFFEVTGTPATLPGGLAEAAEKAEVFSGENKDNNQVLVEVRRDALRVTGMGSLGSYWETKKIVYAGPSMAFTIAPKLLAEITKNHNECEIAPGRLIVNGGRFKYVTLLGEPQS